MSILVRNEKFGYIAMDQASRQHFFVQENEKVLNPVQSRIRDDIWRKFNIEDDVILLGGENTCENVDINSKVRLSAPLCLYLEITKCCPLDCKHCYKPDDPDSVRDVSLDGFLRILDEAVQMGVFEVRLCGNEPVLSPFFSEVCSFVKTHKMHLSINTSGRLNRESRDRLVSVCPDFVVVSLDGIKDTHDSVRAKGAYEMSLKTLQILQQNNISRRINSVLSKATMNYIEDVVKLASQYQCGISFIPLRTMGKVTAFKEEESFTKQEMLQCVRKVTSLRKIYFDVPMEIFFDILGGSFTAHHTMDFNSPCPAGKNGFVSAEGKMYPCDWIRYLGDEFYCGDVLKYGLRSVWNNSDVLHSFQKIERKKCQNCEYYLNRCYGGCWCSYKDTIKCGEYEDMLCPVELV